MELRGRQQVQHLSGKCDSERKEEMKPWPPMHDFFPQEVGDQVDVTGRRMGGMETPVRAYSLKGKEREGAETRLQPWLC